MMQTSSFRHTNRFQSSFRSLKRHNPVGESPSESTFRRTLLRTSLNDMLAYMARLGRGLLYDDSVKLLPDNVTLVTMDKLLPAGAVLSVFVATVIAAVARSHRKTSNKKCSNERYPIHSSKNMNYACQSNQISISGQLDYLLHLEIDHQDHPARDIQVDDIKVKHIRDQSEENSDSNDENVLVCADFLTKGTSVSCESDASNIPNSPEIQTDMSSPRSLLVQNLSSPQGSHTSAGNALEGIVDMNFLGGAIPLVRLSRPSAHSSVVELEQKTTIYLDMMPISPWIDLGSLECERLSLVVAKSSASDITKPERHRISDRSSHPTREEGETTETSEKISLASSRTEEVPDDCTEDIGKGFVLEAAGDLLSPLALANLPACIEHASHAEKNHKAAVCSSEQATVRDSCVANSQHGQNYSSLMLRKCSAEDQTLPLASGPPTLGHLSQAMGELLASREGISSTLLALVWPVPPVTTDKRNSGAADADTGASADKVAGSEVQLSPAFQAREKRTAQRPWLLKLPVAVSATEPEQKEGFTKMPEKNATHSIVATPTSALLTFARPRVLPCTWCGSKDSLDCCGLPFSSCTQTLSSELKAGGMT